MHEQRSNLEAPPTSASQHEAITLIQAMQQELDSLRDQLAWSDRLSSLGELSAALAHEFNNLLTPIGSYAQLAMADLDDPAKTRRALNAAVQGVAQADQLVSATLNFASPHANEKAASAELEEVTERAAQCIAIGYQQDNISLDIQVENESIAIDPLALQQVLINLLSNARSAMRGQPRPRRLTVRSERGDGVVDITVADTGRGIPDAIRDRLFEPFVTSPHNAATPSDPPSGPPSDPSGEQGDAGQAGTGLGLSICKRLIESAGGTIGAQSTPGQGTTFHLRLRSASPDPG